MKKGISSAFNSIRKETDNALNLGLVKPKVIGWGRRGERTPRIEVSTPRLNKMPKENFIVVSESKPMQVRLTLTRACKDKAGKNATDLINENLQGVLDAT